MTNDLKGIFYTEPIEKHYIPLKGSLHPSWTGGKPHCLGCGKQLTHYETKRCKPCANKGNRHPNWKGGNPTCLDCGKQLSSREYFYCRLHVRAGARSYQWKGGVTPKYKLFRRSYRYRLWRQQVFQRDDFTCQGCGTRGGYLQADHIKPFALFPDLRLEPSNGQTLCRGCHQNKTEQDWKQYELFHGGIYV